MSIIELSSAVKRLVTILAAMRPGETRVPIPNTRVKTRAADGTILETVWESRWPPVQKKKIRETNMYLENCI